MMKAADRTTRSLSIELLFLWWLLQATFCILPAYTNVAPFGLIAIPLLWRIIYLKNRIPTRASMWFVAWTCAPTAIFIAYLASSGVIQGIPLLSLGATIAFFVVFPYAFSLCIVLVFSRPPTAGLNR